MPLRPSNEYIDAYAIPGEHSIIDVIDPETGLTAVLGQTYAEVQVRYPKAERTTVDAWTTRRAAEQDTPIVWTRTTRAKYWEMLEVLPPALWIGGAFLVGEPTDHHASTGRPRFAAYWQRGSSEDSTRYLVASRPLTRAELRAEVRRCRDAWGAWHVHPEALTEVR